MRWTVRKGLSAVLLCLAWVMSVSQVSYAEPLLNGGFKSGLTGWEVNQSGGEASPGSVSVADGAAVLAEGDSFLVSLKQTFQLSGPALSLSFSGCRYSR